MFVRVFCFLFSLSLSAYLSAQYANLKFENFSTLEGLSSSTCLEVFQDSEGFLWFGTIDGLNKYNGYDFKVYRPILGDENSISNNRINSIAEDLNGNLWIGTSNGLNLFSKTTKRFYRVPLNRNNGKVINAREVINVIYFQKSKNTLWVGSKSGVSKVLLDSSQNVDINLLEFRHFTRSTTGSSIDNNDVTSIVEDSENTIWVGTEGNCLNKYDPVADQFLCRQIDINRPYQLDQLPKSVLLDRSGRFWIGNDLSRLVIWERDRDDFELVSPVQDHIPIFDIFQDRQGIIWVATDGYGIYLLDPSGHVVQHITHNPDDPFSLPNNQPSKILQGSDGIFWLATYNKGMVKLALSKSSFGHYFYQADSRYGLSTRIAQSVLQDQKGRIWIGTDGGGLNLFNEEDGTFRHFRHDPQNPKTLSSDKILYLAEGNDGNLWVSTWDGGLNKFDPVTKQARRFKHDPADPHSIGQNTVWCAIEDRKHRVWAGTQTSGLNVLDPVTGEFHQFINIPGDSTSLISDFVFTLFVDSQQRLLIGTALGLCYLELNKVSGPISDQLDFKEVKEKNIQGIRVNYITEDHLGNIWLGTDLGLHKLSADLDLQKTYSTIDGIPNNLIIGIQEDDDHHIWMTTKSGLSRLNPTNDQFKNFNIHDGLQGLEFQSKSIARTSDGRIIAGGINGFNIFHPNAIDQDSVELLPKITSLRLLNKVVNAGDTVNNRILLEKSIDNTPQLDLKYFEGYLTFEFVALHYYNADRVKYAYKMVGLDKDFVNAGTNRTANYSGIQPGDYTFEVRASLDGDWENAASTSLKIYVAPPPWRTWWAYLSYMIVIGSVVWGSFRIYVNRMNEERKHELDQMKLRFFMNVSHEFRTPLTLILNPVDKIISSYQDQEVVKNSAYIIQRSARKLLNLVNQLLDFRKLDLGKAPLDPIKGDIIKYSKDVYRFYEELAKSKSINIRFKSELDSYYMWFDPDKLEKILGNLLSNAIKFTKSGGDVEVFMALNAKRQITDTLKRNREKNECMEITVKDTGIGLKKDQLSMVFERFFHVDSTQTGTGIGLNFTKTLVEQHDGEITVESEYQKGTTFKVILPVNSRSIDQAIKSNKEVRSSIKEFDSDMIKSLEYDLAIMDTETGEEPVQNGATQTVLIVEDNKELRNHLKNELRPHYKIKEAADGKEGLEKAKSLYPDIIISDVMMPEMDGFEMCGNLKTDSETSHIPIILLTARTLEEDRFEGYSIGADAYLPKPFNVNVLKARINNLLESKRKMRERFMKKTNILPSSEIATNSLDEQFLDRATEAIISNISDSDFGLEELLEKVGVSRSHFYRKVQSLTGQNPSNFIRTIRLKYAAELLKQNSLSIKEVAYKCGFNSTAYFSKTFRELFDMTPNEFIQKHSND